MKNGLQVLQVIAEVIIAIAAVVGIGLSLRQSKQTTELVIAARESFLAQSFPVIKFSRYQWFSKPPGATCDNPAFGINVYYQNMSGVPVAIEKSDLKIAMGGRPILAGPAEVTLDMQGDSILPPGAESAVGGVGDEFSSVYKRLLGAESTPHLNLQLTLIYRSLASGAKYAYTGSVVIFDDCRVPKQKFFQVGSESIKPI